MIFLNNIEEKHKKYLVLGFFALLLIIGLSLYKDYGLSWDEPISHVNGQVSLSYVSKGDPELLSYSERYYGTIFEMPFAWAQQVFNITTPQKVFFLRHIGTFLLFVVGVFFFYLLCLKRFKSEWLALLGSTFLVLSPRIFADAFYNSKDIPVMVFFIVAIYTLERFLKDPSIKNVLWHSFATALIIATRIPGIFVLLLTAVMVTLHLVILPEVRIKWKKMLTLLGVYVIATVLLTILFWPFLWQHPLAHFGEAFADMSKFSRQLGMQVLYLGDFLVASKLPWHYIPTWILVTTPFLYLLLFFVGIGAVIKRFSRNFVDSFRQYWPDISVLGWLLGPLFAVIILHSVLYDGWRHLYFVYPSIIYLAMVGIEWIIEFAKRYTDRVKKVLRAGVGAIVVVQILVVLIFMIKSHPYQNVYFNFLAGGMEQARKNFDLDYWGLSFREGLEYIATHDSDKMIPVYFAGGSLDNTLILAPEVASRFEVLSQADIARAKYVLSNYRWQQYDQLPHQLGVFSVKVRGESILSVFKVR
ncbi:MAG: glycosyltransferase family 39 protein [Patescibacteria group bacterium]